MPPSLNANDLLYSLINLLLSRHSRRDFTEDINDNSIITK